MDPLVTSYAVGTNEVHHWGDLHDPVPCSISQAMSSFSCLDHYQIGRSCSENTDCHQLDDTDSMYNTIQDIFRNKCYSNLYHQ